MKFDLPLFRTALMGMALTLSLVASAAMACPDCGCEHDEDGNHITVFDKDRKAILAMAGEFKVKFQFQETLGIDPSYELKEPYHSKAVEMIEVIEDTGERIVMQHLLIVEPKDGGEPRVVKHWRQDWVYQDTEMLTFQGNRVFGKVELSEEEVAGTWTQAVYQVDDSPRYESYGKWVHLGDRSSWESEMTWRPLPRREHSKRSDYGVLVARNRHTITPSGWVHEQDNQKLVIDADGQPVKILAHESGFNVYDRVDGIDFSAGREYWEDTQAYWQDVRELWLELVDQSEQTHVAVKVEDKPVFAQLFRVAGQVRKEGEYTEEHKEAARRVILASIDQVSEVETN